MRLHFQPQTPAPEPHARLTKVLGVLVDHVDSVSDLGEGSFVGCVDGADGKGNPDT